MKHKRVGNGSSKYDFDNGASLDADVAATVLKIDNFKRNFKNVLSNSGLSMEQMRNSIVDVMEDYGFLTRRERDSINGKT